MGGSTALGRAGARAWGAVGRLGVRVLLREALSPPLWGKREEARSQEGNGPVFSACKAWQRAPLPRAPPETVFALPAARAPQSPSGLEAEEAFE